VSKVGDARIYDESSEGEHDDDTITGDETMHDGEKYNGDDDNTNVESIFL
jgi:hypothetical protein